MRVPGTMRPDGFSKNRSIIQQMHFESGGIYHLYNRGNNKAPIFFRDGHYLYFLRGARQYLLPGCDILGWCLMPNHFHFVIAARDSGCSEVPSFGGKGMQVLSKNIGKWLSAYSQAINKERGSVARCFSKRQRRSLWWMLSAGRLRSTRTCIISGPRYGIFIRIRCGQDWCGLRLIGDTRLIRIMPACGTERFAIRRCCWN